MTPEPLVPPALEYLLTAYFHQDCDLDGTSREILERVGNNSTETVIAARDAAAVLLTYDLSDAELGAALHRGGLDYSPAAEGLNDRQWLELVVECLSG